MPIRRYLLIAILLAVPTGLILFAIGDHNGLTSFTLLLPTILVGAGTTGYFLVEPSFPTFRNWKTGDFDFWACFYLSIFSIVLFPILVIVGFLAVAGAAAKWLLDE